MNSFSEIIKEAKYNIPGDPNALFFDNDAAPNFLISAMISDFEIDFCYGSRLVNKGYGSGFVISENGHILTNQHVVGNSDRVIVLFLNGIEIEGKVIRSAEVRDVALIKVPLARSKAIPVKLVEPEIGDTVFAIGAALFSDLSGTVSQGIVNSFRMIDD